MVWFCGAFIFIAWNDRKKEGCALSGEWSPNNTLNGAIIMGILDFEAAAKNTNTSRSAGRQAQADRPAAKLWLNVGYDANGRFVNLPVGIPVDTMETLPIRGQNEEWAQFQSARNDLLKAIQEAGDNLEPGAEVEVKLVVKLRKVNEEIEVSKEDNPFAVNLSSLIG